ncbi:hypothetical protein P152DRAFT_479970, partial [Eremomyces bilateralis CBS 781.70]
ASHINSAISARVSHQPRNIPINHNFSFSHHLPSPPPSLVSTPIPPLIPSHHGPQLVHPPPPLAKSPLRPPRRLRPRPRPRPPLVRGSDLLPAAGVRRGSGGGAIAGYKSGGKRKGVLGVS